MRIVQDTFRGLAIIAVFLAPGVIGALIAKHYYGHDAAFVGAFAPYFAGLFLLIAYVIGSGDVD